MFGVNKDEATQKTTAVLVRNSKDDCFLVQLALVINVLVYIEPEQSRRCQVRGGVVEGGENKNNDTI